MSLLDRRRGNNYNCADYAAELWARETGEDITDVLKGFRASTRGAGLAPRTRRPFTRIRAPIDPCLVLLRRGKSTLHVGVFVRGRVQHLTEHAPIRQPLDIAALGYQSVRLYAPCPSDS